MDPASSPVFRSLAPTAQTACYEAWIEARVLLRDALTASWTAESWAEGIFLLPRTRIGDLAGKSRLQVTHESRDVTDAGGPISDSPNQLDLFWRGHSRGEDARPDHRPSRCWCGRMR